MKKHLLKFMQHSLIYGVSNILSRTVTFFLLPLYLAYLSASDYGILEISNTFFSLLFVILLLNIDSGLFKLFYDKTNQFTQEEKVGTVFSFYLIYGLIVSLILILISPFISNILYGNKSFIYITNLVIISAFLQGIVQLYLALYRMKEKPLNYCIFNVMLTIILALLNILFVVYFKKSFVGIREASVIGIGFIAFILFSLNRIKIYFNKLVLKKVLNLCLPLAGSGLASWVFNLTDRYMIRVLYNQSSALKEVGVYGLSAKYASIVQFILVFPFMMAWSNLMFTYQHEKNAKEIYAKVLDLLIVASMFIYLFISMFSKQILNVLTDNVEFSTAYTVIPFLALSYIIYAFYMVFTVGVTLMEKTKFMMYSDIIAAVFNIFLNFLLIPNYGFLGASISTLVSINIRTGLLYIFSQRCYHIPYKIKTNTIIVLISFFSAFYCNQFADNLLLKLLLLFSVATIILIISPIRIIHLLRRKQ